LNCDKLAVFNIYKVIVSIYVSMYNQTSRRARVAQRVRYLDYLATHTSLSSIRRGFAPGFVNYKKGCTRLAAESD